MFSRRAESMNVIDGTKFLCEPKWGAAGFFLAAPLLGSNESYLAQMLTKLGAELRHSVVG
jgi:hypothetical protein